MIIGWLAKKLPQFCLFGHTQRDGETESWRDGERDRESERSSAEERPESRHRAGAFICPTLRPLCLASAARAGAGPELKDLHVGSLWAAGSTRLSSLSAATIQENGAQGIFFFFFVTE